MNIEKIKINGSGYLVNDVLYIPTLTDEIKQWLEEGNTPEPEFTEEETLSNELNEKISYAKQYLSETDWVKDYKLRHDLGLELIPKDSSKWEVINKRAEYITFLKEI